MAAYDSFFQMQHRRLREKFSMETLTRHEDRLLTAMSARCERLRAAVREQEQQAA